MGEETAGKRRIPHLNLEREVIFLSKATGTYAESFTSSLLTQDNMPTDKDHEDIARWCAGGLYVGASDTVRRSRTCATDSKI